MARAGITVLAFAGGAAAGYALSIVGYILATSVGVVFDRDGGVAMGVAFGIGPIVAVVCGIGAAIWMTRRAKV